MITTDLTAVIGLGEVGRPLLELVSERIESSIGIDQDPVPLAAGQHVGVAHICFPDDQAGRFVPTVANYAEQLRPELIIIHSTVEPGTTRKIAEATEISAVHSPVRGKHHRMRADLRRYVKYVAGTDELAVQVAKEHLERLGFETATLPSPETSELAKLFETTYFALLIGWAQEMNRSCERAGVDYMDVCSFLQEVPYLPDHIFVPGHIGGHCLMENIAILKRYTPSKILCAIEASNTARGKELSSQERSERHNPLRPGARK